jgi:LysR family transcriptional regulator, hydrogen peroxide-inducible genes activator
MEMHQVRYFLAVTKERNFTRAAELCNVSPPSLFRAIKLLESEFGGPLFNRERSRTHLTELGRIVAPYLEQIAAAALLAKTETDKVLSLARLTLNVGIMCTIAPQHFTEIFNTFRDRNQDVTVTIVDDAAMALRTSLLAGAIDIAIFALPDEEPDDRLHKLPLFREDMVAAVACSHRLASLTEIQCMELNGEPYIERINCEFGQYGEKLFTSRGVEGPTMCKSSRDDWVLELVASGFGYAFLPQTSATHIGVKCLKLNDIPAVRQVDLNTVRGRPHSPGVAAFLREVAQVDWTGDGVRKIVFNNADDQLEVGA